MEDTIPPISAHGERLGTVLEGVWRGLNALVADLQRVTLLGEHKFCIGAATLDGMGSHVAGYPEMTGIGLVAHGLQFADGDVVALVRLNPGDGQVDDGAQDNHCGRTDAESLRRYLHCIYKGRSAVRFRQARFRQAQPFRI